MKTFFPPSLPFFNQYNRTGWVLIAAAFVFWLGETWIFGWNLKPQSEAERFCDTLALVIWSIGCGHVGALSRVSIMNIFLGEMARWTTWMKANPMEKIDATDTTTH